MIRFVFRLILKAVSFLLLVGIALAIFHLYRSGRLPYVQQAVEDTAVTGSVKAAFAVHRDLAKRTLEITTEDGIVTLSGNVATEDERASAAELAASVDGVESVDNRLEVDAALTSIEEGATASSRSLGQRIDDAALLTKIRTALHLDRKARKIDLDIQVSSGRVVVRGEVPSEEMAELIRTRVASVDGVEAIDDELRLEQP